MPVNLSFNVTAHGIHIFLIYIDLVVRVVLVVVGSSICIIYIVPHTFGKYYFLFSTLVCLDLYLNINFFFSSNGTEKQRLSVT